MKTKLKSFTLSELLVTMIITVIVVGIAFTVLNLIQKQIAVIQDNYNRNSEFAFFKQRLSLDFNKNNDIAYNPNLNQIVLKSDFDTVTYVFGNNFVLRDKDTLKVKIAIEKLFFQGKEINNGVIDAVAFLENKEARNHHFFVFKNNDATFFMNKDGF